MELVRDCVLPSRPPAFVDLFSGIGGMRLGFEAAGAECVFSSEINRFSRKTYERNFRDRPAGDITGIAAGSIPAHDILVAGFPCQPFSIAGVSKYGSLGREHGFLDKTKGTLFFHIARILRHHRPKAFLLENVKNLKSHNRGRTFGTILDLLEKGLGYVVHHRVLDARVLVPQRRERIFIVGFQEAAPFQFPELEDRRPRFRTILEADPDPKYTLSNRLWAYLQAYAAKHRQKGNGFGYGMVDLDGVSRTLSARYFKDGSEILIPQPGRNPRRLTPRECARLMGFPDEFQIPVSDTQAYQQFGNAVVPPLVERIAVSILRSLGETSMAKGRSSGTLPLASSG